MNLADALQVVKYHWIFLLVRHFVTRLISHIKDGKSKICPKCSSLFC